MEEWVRAIGQIRLWLNRHDLRRLTPGFEIHIVVDDYRAAHHVERALGISSSASGLRIVDTPVRVRVKQ